MICSVKGIDIHYHVVGTGKPVLLIHGFYPDHRLMMGCMEPVFATREGFKRIYIDLPGMGQTKAADWIFNADDMLDIVLGFIDQVLPDERLLLGGQSYGGFLSRGIVYKKAEQVDGVLLLCPCIFAEREKRDRPEHKVLVKDEKLIQSLDPKDAALFCQEVVVQSPRNWQRFRDEVACGMAIADAEFLEAYRARGFNYTFDVDAKGKVFNKPSLFLFGKQDYHVGYRDGWRIMDNYPKATFVALDCAGHSLQIEKEAVFHTLVADWLDRCSTF